MNRPLAVRIARLRAAAAPVLPSCTSTWSRGSAAASRSASARLPSVEPSSTSSISQSGKICACTEATVAASVAAAFHTGVMTETAGETAGEAAALIAL